MSEWKCCGKHSDCYQCGDGPPQPPKSELHMTNTGWPYEKTLHAEIASLKAELKIETSYSGEMREKCEDLKAKLVSCEAERDNAREKYCSAVDKLLRKDEQVDKLTSENELLKSALEKFAALDAKYLTNDEVREAHNEALATLAKKEKVT